MAAADGAGVLSFAGRAVRQIVRHAVSERKCECHVEGCACCDWTGVQPEAPEGAAPAGVTAPIDPIYFMSKMLEGLAAGDADKSLAYARHYIEQLEASGSASQAKRLRDAMDGTARMVGLAAPAGAHCNDCTDPHCHGAAPAVSREASVPLLIDQLADRLEDWAQNEEMIDQFFLGHGKDCNEAAKLLRALSSAPGERT
jgi:hypothetical protein